MASLSIARACVGPLLLAGGPAFIWVRQTLKSLHTRRQRERMAGERCVKTCCQSSGGNPTVGGRPGLLSALGSDSLTFLVEAVESWAAVAALVPFSISASLSFRFAPACAGPGTSISEEAAELEESDISMSMSSEASPASS
jgi:hypothetical protein